MCLVRVRVRVGVRVTVRVGVRVGVRVRRVPSLSVTPLRPSSRPK